MLKFLRHKKTAKKIWIGLAVIIVPAFVLWGSGSLIRSRQEQTYAGILFGKKISFLEFRDAFNAQKASALIQFGEKLSEVEPQLNLEALAWERLMLLYEAKSRKIRATDKEVVDFLQNLPFFRHDGKFDTKTYNQIVQYVFQTQPRIFEEQTRQNIILSKLYKQVTDPVFVTDEEVKKEYELAYEEFSISYITASPEDFTKDVTLSEQNLKDYFVKNTLSFKQPVSFNLDYIEVESEDQINQVMMRLKKHEDLQKIAEDLGTAVKQTGKFSQTEPIPGIGWSAEIMALISKLSVGQHSPPVRMDNNYFLLKLKERKEGFIPDFEEVKEKVKEAYVKDESAKIAKQKAGDCLKILKEQADFEKAARESGLKSGTTDTFKYASYIEGLGASDQLWMAAKRLKDEETSDILSLPSGFFIIKIRGRTPIEGEKFESEKSEFREKILLQKKQFSFAQFVAELKRKTF
ncbi:MAG: SurA N-terminal domain-containing protein [Candidatus Omnitrophota bacterium]